MSQGHCSILESLPIRSTCVSWTFRRIACLSRGAYCSVWFGELEESQPSSLKPWFSAETNRYFTLRVGVNLPPKEMYVSSGHCSRLWWARWSWVDVIQTTRSGIPALWRPKTDAGFCAMLQRHVKSPASTQGSLAVLCDQFFKGNSQKCDMG